VVPRSTTADEMLLITLLYLRQYLSQIVISWILNLDESRISEIIRFTTTILYNNLQSEIILPDTEARLKDSKNLTNIATNKVVPVTVCIDGSEQPVFKASDRLTEELHFSGKKGKHTLSLLLACSPSGKIYWISNSYPGSVNDQGMYNIPTNQFHQRLTKDEGIVLDAGFTSVLNYDNFMVSLKKPPNEELTPEQENFNNKLKSIRIVVENVFASIKRWHICRDSIRASVGTEEAQEFHHKFWVIIAALHNMFTPSLRII